jgi:dipeptidyl aminopeptidase/acylaminoacyl peptidase
MMMPLWSFNAASFALLSENTGLAALTRNGRQELRAIHLPGGESAEIEAGFSFILGVAASEKGAAINALSDDGPQTISWLPAAQNPQGDPSLATPALAIRKSAQTPIPPDYINHPRILDIPAGGERIYGIYYPPRNPLFEGTLLAPPPAIISLHGGPTASAARGLKPRVLFFTSRGFAVLDLNYSGSAGYGRAYRDRLYGEWGVRDVADTIAAAGFLGEQGLADPSALFLTGGSAGGYTVLMTIAKSDAFRGAASSYGICDLRALQRTTHKFEAGYISTLVGARLEDNEGRYLERSAITLSDRIRTPLILFQGDEDKVVPPEQSEAIARKLRARGVPVEYHLFAGEGHGFRKAETISFALNAELAFYQRLLLKEASATA